MTYLELYHQLTVLHEELARLRRAVCSDPIAGPVMDGQFQPLEDRLDDIITALPTLAYGEADAGAKEAR